MWLETTQNEPQKIDTSTTITIGGINELLQSLLPKKLGNVSVFCGRGFAKEFVRRKEKKGRKRNPWTLKEYKQWYL